MNGNDLTEPVLRVHNEFEFNIPAPLKAAAPLFGPEGERGWAGEDWDPQFVFPIPARDTQGAVFTVSGEHARSIWVNTIFDLENGRMQYVYLLPDAFVTRIDVRLTQSDREVTRAHVVYERTALHPQANPRVQKLGEHDRNAGPEWQTAIEKYLAGLSSHPGA